MVCYKSNPSIPSDKFDYELAKLAVNEIENHPSYLSYEYFYLARVILGKAYPCSLMDQFKYWLTFFR